MMFIPFSARIDPVHESTTWPSHANNANSSSHWLSDHSVCSRSLRRLHKTMASLIGAQAGQQPQVSPVDMMVAEMKGMADIFFRMQSSCYNKCIASVKEEKLSVGEMSCVDRCVNKFMDVHSKAVHDCCDRALCLRP
ncbi:Tim10 [Symbiodinium natans]|uniref:Mitochondrial import inner membrane translocase subunit n=1 Tax=Symbiodinium natans TaxID=878477 RepID=A0A812PUH8_9DINO|nr:Tim10 [Symbiodinium natans]